LVADTVRPLLILRPQPGADHSADSARALGLDPLVVPLFSEESMDWDQSGTQLCDAMMFTSARAVRLAGPGLALLSALPVCAVGAATAAAARDAGLWVVMTGSGDADALVRAMANADIRRALWLCGRDRRDLTPPSGLHIDARPVYATVAQSPPPGWRSMLNRKPVVMLHSARAAAHFGELAAGQRAELTLVAISAATAAAAGSGWRHIEIADQPTDGAMLALAAKLCQDAAMMSPDRRPT
jgi:uroporphyrinogen-III synthase